MESKKVFTEDDLQKIMSDIAAEQKSLKPRSWGRITWALVLAVFIWPIYGILTCALAILETGDKKNAN